jgi:hydroxymethylpyrimidine/phosphomethylpyrimidine kinase
MTTPPVALTIAGSDSGGGAGIQADLRTFAAFGVHGCTAISALTAQNSTEVRRMAPTDPDLLRDQIEAVLDDLPVAAVKTGLLATADNVRVVAQLAAAGRLPNLVVDPVIVSSTGTRMLDEEAERAYMHDLFPHATAITPNCREAAALLRWEPFTSVDRQYAAAEALSRTGARLVLVKGGDAAGEEALDVYRCDGADIGLTETWVETTNTHGTGCSLSSAIAAQLAQGTELTTSVHRAKQYIHRALLGATDWRLGAGHGPIDHLGWALTPTERTPT